MKLPAEYQPMRQALTKQKIIIIDYGMGNIHSVETAVQAVKPNHLEITCSNCIEEINSADKLIFPGVGAIRDTINPLREQGLTSVLAEQLFRKPSLAICVGMQALTAFSEENQGTDCLDIISAKVRRFNPQKMQADQVVTRDKLKIPHIGWNQVKQNLDHPLWHQIPDRSYFYFVHSYHLELTDKSLLAGTCNYGMDFPAAIYKGSLFATQFHPEKSDKNGLQLIKNFLQWDGKP